MAAYNGEMYFKVPVKDLNKAAKEGYYPAEGQQKYTWDTVNPEATTWITQGNKYAPATVFASLNS